MSPNFSQLIINTPKKSTSILLACCDLFGLRMAKSLPPVPNNSTSVGKLKFGAVIVGRMALLAMDWLRKCWHLWQNIPENLMAVTLTGIAQWMMFILEKTMALLQGEGFERGRSQMATQNFKGGHLEYLILSSHGRHTVKDTDSLVEDGYFREHLSGFEHTEMDMMHLEEEGISELCSMSPSIFGGFGNYWEDSSKEDIALEDMESPGGFPSPSGAGPAVQQECCYHSQMSSKSYGYFGKNPQDDCSHHEELKDFEADLWKRFEAMESTSVSQEEGQILNGDFTMHEDQRLSNLLGTSKAVEHLDMSREGGDEGPHNLEPAIAPHGFKSSLVLSLFYSPSEEEGDEEEDSEDWWSEDEIEASTPLGMSLNGIDSAKGVADLEVKDDSLQRKVLENICGSFSVNNDPFHPLCFSKPIEAPKPHSSSPPEPKHPQEIGISFYLTRQNSKPEQLCSPSQPPWPRKDPRATYRRSVHKCLQPDSRKNCDSVTSETSSTSQEENRVIKKVRFSPVVTVHPLVVWNYASRAARRGPWEEMARDRCRFHRRIAQVGAILEPCLEMEHRAKIWRKIYGAVDSVQKEDNTNVPLSQPC